MVSETFRVVASDQYADKFITQHLAPRSIAKYYCKWQLSVSSTSVAWLGDLLKERQSSHSHQLTPDKLLSLNRLHAGDDAIVNCLKAKSTKVCKKQQNVTVQIVPNMLLNGQHFFNFNQLFLLTQSDIRQKGDGNIQGGGLKFLGHFIRHFRSQVSSESSKILKCPRNFWPSP